MNEIYKLKCEVLSPIHIGDGSEIEPLEYVIEDKFYKINLNEFLYSLSDDLKNRLKELQNKNDLTGIRSFIKENIDLEKFKDWYSDVSETVKNIYKEKFDQPQNQLVVNPFIRSNNKPYIPGSSIKGAIRTAILNQWSHFIEGEPKDKRKAQNVEAEILNALVYNNKKNKYSFNMAKDPFRALKIRDAFLPENSTIFSQVSNFRIDENNRLNKTNIQMILEVTKSSILDNNLLEFDLELLIDKQLFDNPKTGLQSRKIDIDLLLSSCNNFYTKVLDSERKRIFESRDENIATIYEMIKEKARDGYLLRIGRGSGFESITIEKFREPKNPIRGKQGWGFSKMIVENSYPMGFIKIKK